MPKTAILLGATGATGSELLKLLLNDNRYDTIKLFSRKASGVSHPKVKEYVIDLFALEQHATDFTGDVVFCCIGTTKAKTPDTDTYYKIDYGIPVAAAALAALNGIRSCIVISALGADKNSGIFYNRTKGQMQEAVLEQGISNTHLLQPALIVADRPENRLGEKIASAVFKLINPILIGSMKKYRSIAVLTIARAMIWLDNNSYPKIIVPSDEIQELGR
ncbi:MAG: NAD(P)H-binding protein [Bacteroidia bacterium]